MSKPTWVIVYAIFMFLVGGCSLFNDIGDLNIDKLEALQDEIIDVKVNANVSINGDNIKSDTFQTKLDTMSEAKIDTMNQRLSKILGDTLARDEDGNVDMQATLKKATVISDYRKVWTKRFAMISMVISILFIIGGIFLLRKNKITVPFIITVLSTSMAFGLFQFFIYKADEASGSLIAATGKFEVIFSIVVDVMLLIVFMVLDKSYYTEEKYTEDF